MKGTMRTQIMNYLRAGYPGIYLVSHEEARVEAEIKAIAQTLNYLLFTWSVTEGLVDLSDGQVRKAQDPMEMLTLTEELPENSLLVLRDFHQFLEDGNPVLTRGLKDRLREGKTRGKTVVILGCRISLPPELEREMVVLHFALPGKEELGLVLDHIAASAKRPLPEGDL